MWLICPTSEPRTQSNILDISARAPRFSIHAMAFIKIIVVSGSEKDNELHLTCYKVLFNELTHFQNIDYKNKSVND